MEERLYKIARELRLDLLRMFYISGTGHMAPAMSCLDILNCLYFAPVIDYERRFEDDRDRVVLSKGHGAAAQHRVLGRPERRGNAGPGEKRQLTMND